MFVVKNIQMESCIKKAKNTVEKVEKHQFTINRLTKNLY